MFKHSSLVWKLLAPVAVLGAVAIPACTTSDSGDDATGGTGSTAGGNGSTAGGVANSSGGSGAVNTAVTNGGAGTTGGSGAVGTGPVGVACNAISTDTITGFDYDAATATSETNYGFGDYSTSLSGYVFAWPAAVAQSFVDSDWHLSGTIAEYAGFNMQFASTQCDEAGTCASGNCNLVNAAAYTGVTFKIWGTSGGTLKMTVSTAANDISDAWLTACGETVATASYGACTPALAAAPNAKYAQSTCASPSATITLDAAATTAATAQTVTLKWTDFIGGKPNASPNPAEITGMLWNFQWEYVWTTEGGGDPTAHSYATDIHIDEIAFTK